MRTYKTTGIVIKRINVGEADRILTIFTKDQGKLQIKAKGVRKITSKRSSHVEPLNHCSFGIYKGKGMPVLTEIITNEVFQSIKSDLQKTGYAYHICELIDGLCPEAQENGQVFDLLYKTLRKLADHSFTSFYYHENRDFPGTVERTTNEMVISLQDNSDSHDMITIIHEFEVELLSILGYWSTERIFSSREAEQIVESILERKLKTLQILPQLQ